MDVTPLDVLEIAIRRGGYPSLVSSRRYRRYEGRPGEIIEKLPPEQRATLRELRSEDIAGSKLDRDVACFGYDDGAPGEMGREAVHKALMAFDRQVLKIPPPRLRPHRRSAV